VVLAAVAQRSIDAQYYVWHGDRTGLLLFEAVWRAAERGVRVRLLLDDANTAGLDETIAALDAHPNIEVRLYNPLPQRSFRLGNFLADFERVNRRMHNKAFIVDNQAAVVGGRNIGDEYFHASDDLVFTDLDVLAVGPAVHDVSDAFDRYWNSPSAYPAHLMVGAADAAVRTKLLATFEANRVDPGTTRYLDAVRETPIARDLLERRLPLEWVAAKVVCDDPAKTLDTAGRTDILLFTELLRTLGPPHQSFDLVSPYFVPGEEGTAALAALAQRGVKVRILTNSLASSDVSAVHAGYAKRRADLLRAGVHLYEFKPSARASPGAEQALPGSGSSGVLHAKTFAVDGTEIFVGSFNFDPRSARLNTEIGLVIDGPAVARPLGKALDDQLAQIAYELRLTPTGEIEWIERTAAGEQRHSVEPGTTPALRAKVWFLSLLPIDWLL
jgi:phosphatidylserine/phosphatidylglycerophosphate/cardiolipin synthase-like enzyme